MGSPATRVALVGSGALGFYKDIDYAEQECDRRQAANAPWRGRAELTPQEDDDQTTPTLGHPLPESEALLFKEAGNLTNVVSQDTGLEFLATWRPKMSPLRNPGRYRICSVERPK